jgi:outer membrane lipoprotein-sorting protein
MTGPTAIKTLFTLVAALAALAGSRAAASEGEVTRSLPPLLTEAIARYAALTSYADTGTVVEEVGGMIHESAVRTSFRRATRDLYLDFEPLRTRYPGLNDHVVADTGQRVVIWMAKGAMQTYSFYFARHTIVAADQQPNTLKGEIASTRGTAALIPSLLYPKALLPGTLLQLEQASAGGADAIAGHRCHVVTGEAAEYYPSGRRTNVRKVTVWLDAESLLVRQVREDLVAETGSHRLTVTLDPVANPAIADTAFAFSVPPAKERNLR